MLAYASNDSENILMHSINGEDSENIDFREKSNFEVFKSYLFIMMKSLDFVDDEVWLRYVVGLGFLSTIDILFVVQDELSNAFETMVLYFLSLVVVIQTFILAFCIWPNNPEVDPKYCLWGAIAMGGNFAYKLWAFLSESDEYSASFVTDEIFLISIISAGLCAVGFVHAYFFRVGKIYKQEKWDTFDKLDTYEVHETNRDPDRELKTLGSFGLLKQYFWPTSDFDVGQEIPVPTRVYTAVFVIWATGVMTFHWIIEATEEVYQDMKKIGDASSEEIAFIEENLSEWQFVTLEQLLEISKYLRIGVETVRGCILCAEVVCAGLVLWSSVAITRAWRKKFLEIYYEAPTFYYDSRAVNIGGSFQFVASMVSYLITGALISLLVFSITFILLASDWFWESLIWNNKDFLIGYALYYALVFGVIQPISKSWITDGDFVRPGMEPYWKFISMMFELFYLPLALLYAIISLCYECIILVLAFFRPDTLVFPRGIEGYQTGYIVFVSNVKMSVNRYKQMHGKVEKELSDEIAVVDDTIRELEKKRDSLAKTLDFYSAIKIQAKIETAEKHLQRLKLAPEVGQCLQISIEEYAYIFFGDSQSVLYDVEIREIRGDNIAISYLEKPFCYGLTYFNSEKVDILDERLSGWKNEAGKTAPSESFQSEDVDGEVFSPTPMDIPSRSNSLSSPMNLEMVLQVPMKRKESETLDEFSEPIGTDV